MGFLIGVILLSLAIIDIAAVVIWIKFLKKVDPFHIYKGRPKLLIWFFLGGCASVIPTMILYEVGYFVMAPFWTGGYAADSFLDLFFINGPVEEFSKFLMFFILSVKLKSIRQPLDGMIQAAAVALGFACIENFMYALDYGYGNLLIRSLLTTGGHVLYGMIWGFFYGYFTYLGARTDKGRRPWRLYLMALLPAAFVHSLYNFILAFGLESAAILMDFIVLAVVIYLFKFQMKQSPYWKHSLKKYKTAIPSIKRGLVHHPDSFQLNKLVSLYYIYAGMYKKANEHLMVCRRLKKKDVIIKLLLGIVLAILEDTEGARIYLNEYLSTATTKQRKLLRKRVARLIPNRENRLEVLSELKLYELLHEDYRRYSEAANYQVIKVPHGTRMYVGTG